MKTRVWGNYLELGARKAGEKLEVTYPMPCAKRKSRSAIPASGSTATVVTWKGDTVVRMTPVGDIAKTGFSDFDGKPVEIYYGTEGPGPLYQRESMLKDTTPKPAPLHLDDGSLDFWYLH